MSVIQDDTAGSMTASFSATNAVAPPFEVSDPWGATTARGLNPLDLSNILCRCFFRCLSLTLPSLDQEGEEGLFLCNGKGEREDIFLFLTNNLCLHLWARMLPPIWEQTTSSWDAFAKYLHHRLWLGTTLRRKDHGVGYPQDCRRQWITVCIGQPGTQTLCDFSRAKKRTLWTTLLMRYSLRSFF